MRLAMRLAARLATAPRGELISGFIFGRFA